MRYNRNRRACKAIRLAVEWFNRQQLFGHECGGLVKQGKN
jgi:hypothetical protein